MKINNKTGAFMVFQALKGSALFLLVSWTIFANTLVFIVLHKNRRLQTVPNLLVGNLAFSDLCLGLIVLPLSSVYAIAGEWIFPDTLCEVFVSADILCSTASIWNLSIVGLDRYWAITSPVTYMSKRNKQTAYIMILSVWISSSLISLAPLLGWKQTAITSNLIYDKNNTVRHCTFLDLPSYTVYSATGSFFIPTLLMFFVYFKIYQAFGKHRARQLYRQKVIRKHIESTILHEISHVLPAHNVFDKDEEEDSESSDQIENDICIENVHTAKEWGDKPSVAPGEESRTAITFTTGNVRWLARTPHVTHRDKMIVRGSAASYVDHNSCKDKKVAMLRPTNIKRYQKRSERHETREKMNQDTLITGLTGITVTFRLAHTIRDANLDAQKRKPTSLWFLPDYRFNKSKHFSAKLAQMTKQSICLE
ncbi:hypothetical protein RB195_023921 [Necator americanus]|uniref:G-protein coupled receptors family 1 profile domain-containing protein n=1 Tax=Necator americanus TaxID=51031 RepID=A0ABR1EL38_NECAM